MKYLVIGMAILVTSPMVVARDFSDYSTEELQQMRGQAREMSDDDRAALRSEMQKRAQGMSSEERQRMGGQDRQQKRQGETMGQGETTRQRSQNGSASGEQYWRSAPIELPSMGSDEAASGQSQGRGMGSGQGQGKGKGQGNGQGQGQGQGKGKGQGGTYRSMGY